MAELMCYVRVQHLGVWYIAQGTAKYTRLFFREDGKPYSLSPSERRELGDWIGMALTERMQEIEAMPIGRHRAAREVATWSVQAHNEAPPKLQRADPIMEFKGRTVLTGTPSPGGMYHRGEWSREYLGQWAPADQESEELKPCPRCNKPMRPGSLHFCMALWQESMDASRRDHSADAAVYAMTALRSAKKVARVPELAPWHEEPSEYPMTLPCGYCGAVVVVQSDRDRGKRCDACREPESLTCRSCGRDVASMDAHVCPSAMFPCPGCGKSVSFTSNDCVAHHYITNRPCAWNGRQRAVVEQEWRRMASAEPKPPTLREWLGDRVAELGPWAEVLREQPVPAGQIVAWHWDHSGPEWLLIASARNDKPKCGTAVLPDLSGVFDRCDDSTDITCWMESLQMALFDRHPDVKPEPKLRTWFGNEED